MAQIRAEAARNNANAQAVSAASQSTETLRSEVAELRAAIADINRQLDAFRSAAPSR
jgi:hypothetical protein